MGGAVERNEDEEVFGRKIRKVLRIDERKSVKDRILELEHKLDTYVIEHYLDEDVVDRCRLTSEHRRIIVNALVEGATPYIFKIQMWKSVEFRRIGDDPEKVFENMYEKEE